MRLKFVKDAYVNDQLAFESGKEYEICDKLGSAKRWMRRGLAVECKDVVELAEDQDNTKPEDEIVDSEALEDIKVKQSPSKKRNYFKK